MNEDRVIDVISKIIIVLFAWVIYPVKWWKGRTFNANKSEAFAAAKERSKGNFTNIYVIQDGYEFYYGTRTELRRIDKRVSKVLRKRTGVLECNFRNAIVAVFRDGKQVEQ